MLIFDLQCDQGHRFEGWFDNHKDLEKHIKNKMISCPVCGAESVRQVPSSFAITKRGPTAPHPSEGDSPDPDSAARLLGEALKRYLKENFEDVGAKFASEALKMHFGASETRNIRGVSTPDEEKMLQREGVNFFKVGPPQNMEVSVSGGGEEEDD